MSPTVIKYIISRKVFVLGRKLYVRKICEICTTALGERRRLRRLHTGWDASWARSPCIFVVCSSILPPPPSEVAFVVRSMLCGYSSEIGYLRSVLGRRSGRRRSAKEELSAEKQVLSEEE